MQTELSFRVLRMIHVRIVIFRVVSSRIVVANYVPKP